MPRGNASAGRAIIYPTNWCHGVLDHCSLSPSGTPSKLKENCRSSKRHSQRVGLILSNSVSKCVCVCARM